MTDEALLLVVINIIAPAVGIAMNRMMQGRNVSRVYHYILLSEVLHIAIFVFIVNVYGSAQ